MIHYVVPAVADLFYEYLEHWGRDLTDRLHVLHYEDLLRRGRLESGTYVFTAQDRLSPSTDARVQAICESADAAPRRDLRLVNRPDRILRRFGLIDALARAGRNDFRAVPAGDAGPDSLRYPVFVRDTRSHRGPISPLLDSAREVDSWIGRAVLAGVRGRDLIVVEFCDTRSADGYYRKYGAFVVGATIVPRGVERGRDWMLKRSGTEFSPGMAEEERAYVFGNPHARELAEVCALAGIEYGRVDYAVKDGRLQVWEINTNPTIGRGSRGGQRGYAPEVDAIRRESKARFYEGFNAAWASIDATPGVRATVAPGPPRRSLAAVMAGRMARERWPVHVERLLARIEPVLWPIARPLCAGVGRRVRARARAAD